MCAVHHFSKYAWALPLTDRRGNTIVNAFQKIISKGWKSNKIWVDQGSKLYNNLLKRLLKINNVGMFLTYNEGKSVVAERFIRTSRNVYFDVLDAIVNKYNNTVHRAIKMKPIDVTSDSYAEYNKDCNEKDPKFGACDLVRI